MGGLAVLRGYRKRQFGVLMFHAFSETDRPNMEAICGHITRHFEPMSLAALVEAFDSPKALPDNAIAVTVDDGYRSFLLHGHPVFRKYRIPATLYAVAGFSEGRLWLWTDQIKFGLQHTKHPSLRVTLVGGTPLELSLGTADERSDSIFRLTEALKEVPNEQRIAFVAEFRRLTGVDLPDGPPEGCEAMTWDELRAVAADGTEIGCHTDSHPILSRLANRQDLEREIRGAKEFMTERLGFEVRHFCYPNGRVIDVGEAAIRCVRAAGFASAVCCTWGLNTVEGDRYQIRRIPFNSDINLSYGEELMAGLHL